MPVTGAEALAAAQQHNAAHPATIALEDDRSGTSAPVGAKSDCSDAHRALINEKRSVDNYLNHLLKVLRNGGRYDMRFALLLKGKGDEHAKLVYSDPGVVNPPQPVLGGTALGGSPGDTAADTYAAAQMCIQMCMQVLAAGSGRHVRQHERSSSLSTLVQATPVQAARNYVLDRTMYGYTDRDYGEACQLISMVASGCMESLLRTNFFSFGEGVQLGSIHVDDVTAFHFLQQATDGQWFSCFNGAQPNLEMQEAIGVALPVGTTQCWFYSGGNQQETTAVTAHLIARPGVGVQSTLDVFWAAPEFLVRDQHFVGPEELKGTAASCIVAWASTVLACLASITTAHAAKSIVEHAGMILGNDTAVTAGWWFLLVQASCQVFYF
jgi:hypothetical protein